MVFDKYLLNKIGEPDKVINMNDMRLFPRFPLDHAGRNHHNKNSKRFSKRQYHPHILLPLRAGPEDVARHKFQPKTGYFFTGDNTLSGACPEHALKPPLRTNIKLVLPNFPQKGLAKKPP